MNIIKAISKDKLVILVTHETELARFFASRIVEIQNGTIIADYKNEEADDLDYRLENKIYLKDFKHLDKLDKNNINLDVYSNDNEKTDIQVVVKNNNIYVKAPENQRIQVVDENSSVEFINEHYKKIDKTIYEEYSYNLDKIINKKYKVRYSSVNGFFKSCYLGVKKLASFSILKKLLLVRIFCIFNVHCIFYL